MKALVPNIKNIPALQIIEVATLILNHSSQMKQIKNQYKLAKNEMNYQYKLQKQALNNDLARFQKMAKLQSEQFNYAHKERSKMLEIIGELSRGISNAPDIELQNGLREVFQLALDEYQRSRDSINFLEQYNTQYSIQGGQ